MAYATVTLSGTYQTPDGTPHKGHVEIIPSERVIKDTTGDIILTGRVKIDLDAQGAFTVALPATDDPTLNPTGFGYTIAAKLHSSHPPAVSFSLPASLGATTVEDLTPVDPSTFAPTTTYAEKSELDAVAATIPSTAADVGALPDTTVIPSTAADVGAVRAGQTGLLIDVTQGPYNADNTGATDASADIQAAMDAASAAGGGTIFLPQGTYRLDTELVPKDHVWVTGAGRTRTELRPQGTQSAMRTLRTSADPLTGFSVTNLTIDGADQTLTDGVYYAGTKGIFFTYGQDCLFQNLHIKNTAATGLGIDMLNRVKIDYVDATNCGRLNPGGAAGGAGIGIGSGEDWAVESFHVSNCTLIGNTNYGLFVERQAWVTPSHGATVSDCYAEGNGVGFADAGMAYLHWTGCTAIGNIGAGFECHPGTVGPGIPGRYGTLVGCTAANNGTDGFYFTNTGDKAGVGGYQIIGGTYKSNGRDGIRIEAAASAIYGWRINGADVVDNDECGIRFRSTGGGLIREVTVTGNNILNNGQDAGASNGHGLFFETAVSVGTVTGNVIADNQPTKTQDYGILVGTNVALTAVNIAENTVINNAVAQIGTAAGSGLSYGSAFRDNVGYNDTFAVESLPVAPTGPLNYTAGNVRTQVYVIGGTVTAVKVNGATIHTNTGVTVDLKPRDALSVEYSSPPVAVKLRKF